MLCLFFFAHIMTGYRDDNYTLSSLFYAMDDNAHFLLLFLFLYFMTGYRDDIKHTLPSSMLCLFSLLHYDRIQGMILSTSSLFNALDDIKHSSLFYAVSFFSACIMTGYRDDIKHTLPSSMQCLFFSAYIMTGYRDDIKHTLPSSVLCLFSLLTL
ncbi:unnamed protein product [Acanthosepion pharaonis]|uniref:Uncharacterized protein n=1 Tax=Acanthosepion pharaonis TaxID=158019 RepID=A0A812BJV1_ACAPH|nr:unnamed protein product [Sepia pharaonis]